MVSSVIACRRDGGVGRRLESGSLVVDGGATCTFGVSGFGLRILEGESSAIKARGFQHPPRAEYPLSKN